MKMNFVISRHRTASMTMSKRRIKSKQSFSLFSQSATTKEQAKKSIIKTLEPGVRERDESAVDSGVVYPSQPHLDALHSCTDEIAAKCGKSLLVVYQFEISFSFHTEHEWKEEEEGKNLIARRKKNLERGQRERERSTVRHTRRVEAPAKWVK